MCIGIPMQIIGFAGDLAVCVQQEQQHLIDIQLVENLEIGTWVLVFLDTAREVVSAEQAVLINNALEALRLSLQGETNFDHLFADLVNREPQLPEFLRPLVTSQHE